jgi:hypothetical protein
MRSAREAAAALDPREELLSPALKERFLAKVEKTEGCWNWTAAKVHNGYGVFNLPSRQQVAHKVSYRLHVGEVPDGYQLDHMCHNRGCVNPDHLRVVTHKQNQENRAALQSNNISGVRGVYWDAKLNKWMGSVKHFGKRHYVGVFDSLEIAAEAVAAKRLELFTHNDLDRVA